MADTSDEIGWLWRLLRTPLLTKLVFADLAVNLVAFLGLQFVPAEHVTEVTFGSLIGIAAINAGLVAWALRPLAALEETARRVSDGEFGARTHLPAFTDRNLARIGRTLNALLDRVESDRERLRALTSEVVATGDRERAHIARELHDGTAQSLSALDMLLATAARQTTDPSEQQRLSVMREVVTEALGEVRALAHNVHPRVLDDLGLPSALTMLARRSRAQGSPAVDVVVEGDRPLSQAVSSVLYRVAQEGLHNALKHARATSVHLALDLGADRARLTVIDDGRGFVRGEDGRQGGMGLFVMEERVTLVGGTIRVESGLGTGTRVVVEIPLSETADTHPALGGVA